MAADNRFPAEAGNLYALWTLDCLADITYAVSNDAISRPQLYQDDIPDDLVILRMAYGTAPKLPNSAQRQAMMLPILGSSDGLTAGAVTTPSGQDFQTARTNFVDACAAFAQQASQVQRAILEDRIRFSAATLRTHFEGVYGKSFALSLQQMSDLSDLVLRILKSPGVTKVFGINDIDPGWPFESADPHGAKLIEAIGATLALSGDYRFTFTGFLSLQRVAQEGSKAIQALLSGEAPSVSGGAPSGEELSSLIGRGYIWGVALREMPAGSQNSSQAAMVTQPAISPQRLARQRLGSRPSGSQLTAGIGTEDVGVKALVSR